MSAVRQKLFGLHVWKEKYELLPLVGFLGGACVMAAAYIGYSIYQKPDVRLNKWSEHPPWEVVNPEQPQKLVSINQRWVKNSELEALRREIGSYRT